MAHRDLALAVGLDLPGQIAVLLAAFLIDIRNRLRVLGQGGIVNFIFIGIVFLGVGTLVPLHLDAVIGLQIGGLTALAKFVIIDGGIVFYDILIAVRHVGQVQLKRVSVNGDAGLIIRSSHRLPVFVLYLQIGDAVHIRSQGGAGDLIGHLNIRSRTGRGHGDGIFDLAGIGIVATRLGNIRVVRFRDGQVGLDILIPFDGRRIFAKACLDVYLKVRFIQRSQDIEIRVGGVPVNL